MYSGIDSGASEHVVSDFSMFQTTGEVDEIQVELDDEYKVI